MKLSQWARRLGDFLGIEPEEGEDPPRASEEAPAEDAPAAAEEPVTEPPEQPEPRRPRRIVHGPGSDEELADLRDIVRELEEHIDADSDE